MRMLTTADLRDKGIKWSRQHIHQKVKAGLFPIPAKLGASTISWPEAEIDAWLRERVAHRSRPRGPPDTDYGV